MQLPHPLNQAVQREADLLLNRVAGALAVVVATIDGFDVAHAHKLPIEPSRLAAMTSSIAAMGDVVTQEANLGKPRCVVVDAKDGLVVVSAVNRDDHALVINVLTNRASTLGLVLFEVAACARRLETA
jgi:uncharacterized protein